MSFCCCLKPLNGLVLVFIIHKLWLKEVNNCIIYEPMVPSLAINECFNDKDLWE